MMVKTLKEVMKCNSQLEKVELEMCQSLDNRLVVYLVRYLGHLQSLSLMNSANHYNHHINYDGFNHFRYARFQLHYFWADYFSGIGDLTI